MAERQGITCEQIYAMLMQSQYWPPEQLLAFQRSQLEQLLRHAKAQVPFYATRLDCMFRSDGSINWERWPDIPIISRADLYAHGQDMMASQMPPGHGHSADFSSSGSTGLPVSVRQNLLMGEVARAATFRAFTWHNVDLTLNNCFLTGGSDNLADVPDGGVFGNWTPAWLPHPGASIKMDRSNSAEMVVEYLMTHETGYVTARPNTLHALAAAALHMGCRPRLSGLFAYGERITQAAQVDCQRAFGAKIIGVYSTTECHKIAHPCPDGTGWHVNSELLLLETIGPDGRIGAPSTVGRSIITPFFNTAQPLIRYDQGDALHWGEPCGCGRTLPIITQIDGRYNDLFALPDGRRVSLHIPKELYDAIATDVIQLAQTGPIDFEVRHVPLGTPQPGGQQIFADYMRTFFGCNVNVTFPQLVAPGFDRLRKLTECVNEYTPEAAALTPRA